MTAMLLLLVPLAQGQDMNDDLAVAPASAEQAAWRGVLPGKTRLADVLGKAELRQDMLQKDEKGGKTTLLFPPACEKGEKRVNAQFGRVVEVVFDSSGLCEYVHIGGFFKETRPYLEDLESQLKIKAKRVSQTSRYSTHSGVFNSPDAGVWFIVSNMKDHTGKHQVLVMRFYKPGSKVELPLPKVPYRR